MSAFGPRAARVAARLGDGLWTLADPESAPEIIEAYRDELGGAPAREPGEIILQAGFSWAADDDAAMEGARVWKASDDGQSTSPMTGTSPPAMYARAKERISDEDFRAQFIVGSDTAHHVERIREIEELGLTLTRLQNASGADPHGALSIYGAEILPALRATPKAPGLPGSKV